MDGVRKARARGGAVRVESREGGAAVIVTVVESGREGRELDAGLVDGWEIRICVCRKTGGGRVGGFWI